MKIQEAGTHLVFEKTAIELAATYYDAARASGLTSVHKDARSYAKANFEKFIPKAVELCIEMLGNPNIPQMMKDEIYNAIQERKNATGLEFMNLGVPEFKQGEHNEEVARKCVLHDQREFDPSKLLKL